MALPSIGKMQSPETDAVVNEAEKLAADAGAVVEQESVKAEEAMVQFTSHPMSRFAFGEFKFVNGLLTLTAEKAKEFEAQWAQQPPGLQRMVQKINVDNAEAVLKKLIDSNQAQAGAIKAGITTTASELPLVHPEDAASADASVVK